MPNKTIYIRREDVELWDNLKNKSQVISDLLNRNVPVIHKVEALNPSEPFTPRPPDPETGYPCCTKSKPCKHWIHDPVNSVWRNELTNKEREIL